jgi:hypothetical protein
MLVAYLAGDAAAERRSAAAARENFQRALDSLLERLPILTVTPELVELELQLRWRLMRVNVFVARSGRERTQARESFMLGLRQMRERLGKTVDESGVEHRMIRVWEERARL